MQNTYTYAYTIYSKIEYNKNLKTREEKQDLKIY